MANTKRLIWLCPEFVPTHEVLFNALTSDGDISLRVEIMMPPTKTHPFETIKGRTYEWGMAEKGVRVDPLLINRVLQEKNAWVVVASYFKPTLFEAMKALDKDNRRFMYYTDTPLLQDIEWNTGKPRRRSILRKMARGYRLKWIFKHAYRILATGMPGVNAVKKLGCPESKIVNFPCWADLTIGQLKVKDDRQIKTILSVGQLNFRKAYDIAIQAFSIALRKTNADNIVLKLVGDGPEKNNLEKLADRLGIKKHVIFEGWLQPPQVAEELRKAAVFIHTARWDPFPVVVLEAMAAGLPILGSDSSGSVLDRVEDRISGFIHRTDDINQLANQIVEVLSDEERLKEMGLAARRKAEEWPPERGVQIIKGIIADD